MRKIKVLIIMRRAFFMMCITPLFFNVGSGSAEAADQTLLSQMQTISPPLTGVSVVQAASPEKSSWKGRMQAGLRSRAILLNSQINNGKPLNQGTDLVTHLFDDINIESKVVRSTRNTNGVTVTTAKIIGSQWGRVFIASSNGQVRAKILAPEQGKIFSIEYNKADDLHYALELDPQQLQVDEEDVVQPDPDLLTNGEESIYQMMNNLPVEENESTDATTMVDVMVVYSNDALTYAGSVDEMNNIIALGMAIANDVHENSKTGLFLHLVHSEQINYTGSGSRETDLDRLYATNDGSMDEVHMLRDTYGADFVSLMLGDYSSNGGLSYLLTSSAGRASWAFSVINAPVFDSYTPVHEIGHNMGLSHAKDQNNYAGPTSWSRDDYNFGDSSAGWHWHPVAGEKGYSSIMAYTGGNYYSDGLSHTRVGLFSDPAISYEGHPSGHIDDGYNALVLRTLKNVYAGYRDRPINANSIVVDLPNGGESFSAGSTQYIQWDSNGVSGNVKIELLNNGALDQVIAANTLNDRVYSWTLPAGLSGKNYTVRISSLDGSITDTSDAVFFIKSVIYEHSMDTDPGYSTSGDWEFGAPYGDNATYGGAASAYTGTNIYDTDLDYVMGTTGYLTSTVFDCSEYEDVQLSFMGWFSVTSGYAAKVEVSNDNVTWTTLSSVSDIWTSNWKRYTFDISSYADEQATVYVRWGHVSTSGGSNYSGMSVDDVNIIGVKKATSVAPSTVSIAPVLFMLLLK
ncbi:Metallo-peptidase family M12B Reprolysin-like [Candidatus Electrothrix aarhusensis]|uniref:Metallo-peptidase family M12B Reprolysin-like n=1 Tax=Candidatus Electrothrix aarhusensis TaxID=1859131 RepID=A0A444IVE6_9BACT|nr:Metallo-peptidase family M12B Reprolysin-like [Candidatus Electrothrix aarhusensis]